MVHWSRKYLGKAYVAGEYDCLDFVLEILSKEYGVNTCIIPNHGKCTLEQQRELQTRADDYCIKIDKPVDGCVVILKQGLRLRHVGIYYEYNNIGYIIHNSSVTCSVVQCPTYRIDRHYCKIERYVKWKRKH